MRSIQSTRTASRRIQILTPVRAAALVRLTAGDGQWRALQDPGRLAALRLPAWARVEINNRCSVRFVN